MPSGDPDRARRAARDLTEATADSYKIAVDRAFAARESGVRMTRHFFEEGMGLMEDGLDQNLRTTSRLAELARQQNDAFRTLSEGSREAYTGFVDSLYDFGEEEGDEGGADGPRGATGRR